MPTPLRTSSGERGEGGRRCPSGEGTHAGTPLDFPTTDADLLADSPRRCFAREEADAAVGKAPCLLAPKVDAEVGEWGCLRSKSSLLTDALELNLTASFRLVSTACIRSSAGRPTRGPKRFVGLPCWSHKRMKKAPWSPARRRIFSPSRSSTTSELCACASPAATRNGIGDSPTSAPSSVTWRCSAPATVRGPMVTVRWLEDDDTWTCEGTRQII